MKAYGIDINPTLIHYNASIRNKLGIIQLLIEISSFLKVADMQLLEELPETIEAAKIRLILYVDKMSRIFIVEKDKIHSFFLPFSLQAESNKYRLFFNGYEITPASCAVMSATFNGLPIDISVEEILESYWDISEDFDISEEEKKFYGKLISYLLSFEPGYLRFDHDESHKNKIIHPDNHIDFNYTDGASFKLGLNNPLTYNDLIEILDITKPCIHLTIPRKHN